MQKEVVEFFKRHPKAEACHLVLTVTFHSAKKASSYRKNMNARKVTVVTSKEYKEYLRGREKVTPEIEKGSK